MASQVLSGSSNPSYTNNTGQNVRVVINYMSTVVSLSWAGVSVSGGGTNSIAGAIGRNLAFTTISGGDGIAASNMRSGIDSSLPTELMLAPGQTFSATCGVYNIVVIPEAG